MWNLLRKKTNDCTCVREAVENTPERSAVPAMVQEHLTTCASCTNFVEEFYETRTLLGTLHSRRYEPSPWFATRVISAIAAQEATLSRSLETWRVVPNLAAKLAGISAIALLLTGVWLYEQPKTASSGQSSAGGESLFENTPTPVPDDLIAAIVEAE
jgi:predicted anti-sigma-YlaC factor YlaD